MQDKKQLDLIISLFSNGKVQEALDQLDPLIKDNPNDAVPVSYTHLTLPTKRIV